MKLIVGLGNPGQKYKNNRHNVGFAVLEALQKIFNFQFSSTNQFLMRKNFQTEICEYKDFVMAKPQGFMNRSGVAVKKLSKIYQLTANDLFVVHDDLDIPLGKFKIGQKGPKVHNGLKSIYEQLGFKNFWHVRIGIDNRQKTGFKGTGEEYVLQNFRPEEKVTIAQVIGEVINALKTTKVII